MDCAGAGGRPLYIYMDYSSLRFELHGRSSAMPTGVLPSAFRL